MNHGRVNNAASSVVDLSFIRDSTPSLTSVLKKVGVFTLTAMVASAVALVCARRISGALVNPLGAGALVASGVVVSGIALLARSASTMRWLPGMFVVAAALAISLPGSPVLGLVALWAIVGVEEGWSLRRHVLSKAAPFETAFSTSSEPHEVPDPLADVAVLQHLVRRAEVDGAESIHGWLRTTFAPGERTLFAHVAFCPPLAAAPNCSAELLDGPSASVRVAQVLPHGARLEIKLDRETPSQQTVALEFSAWTAAARPEVQPT